ncbi:MAG: hypothetical protein KDA56_12205 [Hyphomonas sp.]|nr:hypothetical protein [Hyphomonas sp.]
MISRISLSIAAFAGLAACAAPIGTPPPANQQLAYSTAQPQLNTVNIIDDELQKTTLRTNGSTHVSTKLAVEGQGSNLTAAATREVWVSLRNLTDYPQNVEARVTWYDGVQRPVDGPTAWSRIFIPANGAETFISASVKPASESYYVEVRELN